MTSEDRGLITTGTAIGVALGICGGTALAIVGAIIGFVTTVIYVYVVTPFLGDRDKKGEKDNGRH